MKVNRNELKCYLEMRLMFSRINETERICAVLHDVKEAREATSLLPSGVRRVFDGLIPKNLLMALGNKKNR